MVNVPAALHHPSSLETARFPGGPFHLSLMVGRLQLVSAVSFASCV
jgi:hypothetical protein